MEAYEITGMYVPWRGDGPDHLEIGDDRMLAVYSATERLYEHHEDDGNLTVKRINDGVEFVTTQPADQRIIVDPYLVNARTNRWHYKEIDRVFI